MMKDMTITIYNRNELYNIQIEAIAYLKAEDHYTAAFYHNGTRLLVPVGLSKLAKAIAAHADFNRLFISAGRSYIISRRHISFINVSKELLVFHTTGSKPLTVSLSKSRLRTLIGELNSSPETVPVSTDDWHEEKKRHTFGG